MSEHDRRRQQADLIYELGMLFCEFERIAANPERYDVAAIRRARARYLVDRSAYEGRLYAFASGEPGHIYNSEIRPAVTAATGLMDVLNDVDIVKASFPTSLRQDLDYRKGITIAAIASVPMPETSEIVAAGSPFSAYCVVRDLCETSAREVLWIDPYVNETVLRAVT